MGLKHISKGNLAKKQLGPGLALPWGPDCLTFMLAGHAVTTLVRKSDGLRHTYYIGRAADDVKQSDGTTKEVEKDRWFVHLLQRSGRPLQSPPLPSRFRAIRWFARRPSSQMSR